MNVRLHSPLQPCSCCWGSSLDCTSSCVIQPHDQTPDQPFVLVSGNATFAFVAVFGVFAFYLSGTILCLPPFGFQSDCPSDPLDLCYIVMERPARHCGVLIFYCWPEGTPWTTAPSVLLRELDSKHCFCEAVSFQIPLGVHRGRARSASPDPN